MRQSCIKIYRVDEKKKRSPIVPGEFCSADLRNVIWDSFYSHLSLSLSSSFTKLSQMHTFTSVNVITAVYTLTATVYLLRFLFSLFANYVNKMKNST